MSIFFAGSRAYEEPTEFLTKPHVLKDIKQLSERCATSSLETFRSVLNHCAPKQLAYSYNGMSSR